MPYINKSDRVTAKISPKEAKEKILLGIQAGETVETACRKAGRSVQAYYGYRAKDKEFADKVDLLRAVRANRLNNDRDTVVSDFAEFRRKYLLMETFPHQMQWVDLLEGREPRDLHPSVVYERGTDGGRLLVNTPPNHSKTMTITIDYVTYRICKDPNFRVIVVSKTQEQAKKFLYAIKSRLTHPKYAELQIAFAPAEGFKAESEQWSATKIYLGGDGRDSGEKDPTVEALGMGGQIYGARADLIVLDDCVTLSNANEWEKQMDWVRQEVASRLGPAGKLLVVGTRVAPVDLYRELRNADHYTDGRVPWTYFAQPAVLEYNDTPEKWVTLWPVSDRPFEGAEDTADADGNFPRWTGPRLARIRNELGPSRWSMVYMQQDVEEDAIFTPACVNGSVNGMRKAGALLEETPGHPKHGGRGMVVVAGLDPAMKGFTAAVAIACDRVTKKRYVLDVANIQAPTPAKIRELIETWTQNYSIIEWRVEANAFQEFLTQDEGIRTFLASAGCVLTPHWTYRNKWDPNFGVASMAPLFGSMTTTDKGTPKFANNNLIELPSRDSLGVKALVEQLVTWAPDTKNKTDCVMALWFAELKAREVINVEGKYNQYHLSNQYLAPYRREQRMVVNLNEWAEQRAAGDTIYL